MDPSEVYRRWQWRQYWLKNPHYRMFMRGHMTNVKWKQRRYLAGVEALRLDRDVEEQREREHLRQVAARAEDD